MSSAHYLDGIRQAYEGELVGESLYRRLSEGCASRDQQAKLGAIADVERLTHGRLKPIAKRLGINPIEAEWRSIVDRRAKELAVLTWREFIDKALLDWPPYIPRFAALKPLAPAGDEGTVQLLIDHEVALVEFTRLENASIGSADSMAPLEAFLGRRQRKER
jgi:hypothetical protein